MDETERSKIIHFLEFEHTSLVLRLPQQYTFFVVYMCTHAASLVPNPPAEGVLIAAIQQGC